MVADPPTAHEKEIAKLDARIEELQDELHAEEDRVSELEADLHGEEAERKDGLLEGEALGEARALERLEDIARGLTTLDEVMRELRTTK